MPSSYQSFQARAATNSGSSLSASTVITLCILGAVVVTVVCAAIYKLCTEHKHPSVAERQYNIYDLAQDRPQSQRDRLRELRWNLLNSLEEEGRQARLEAGERVSGIYPAYIPRLQQFHHHLISSSTDPDQHRGNFDLTDRNRWSRFQFPFQQVRDSMRASRGDVSDILIEHDPRSTSYPQPAYYYES